MWIGGTEVDVHKSMYDDDCGGGEDDGGNVGENANV